MSPRSHAAKPRGTVLSPPGARAGNESRRATLAVPRRIHDDAAVPSSFSARLFAFLPLLAALAPARAHADALPPPRPLACPAGTHLVHDHGGTHCVQDAPKNCPVGWRGIEGGQCTLVLCRSDASCGGARCKEVDLCAFDDPSHLRWGEASPVPEGPVSLLGAPPMAARARVYSGPCGAGGTCSAQERCLRASVCLPADVSAPASRPKNAAPAVTFGDERGIIPDFSPREAGAGIPLEQEPPVEEPPAATATPERPPAAPPRPGKAGGCAGCSATPSEGPTGALVLVAVALVARVLRRRAT